MSMSAITRRGFLTSCLSSIAVLPLASALPRPIRVVHLTPGMVGVVAKDEVVYIPGAVHALTEEESAALMDSEDSLPSSAAEL